MVDAASYLFKTCLKLWKILVKYFYCCTKIHVCFFLLFNSSCIWKMKSCVLLHSAHIILQKWKETKNQKENKWMKFFFWNGKAKILKVRAWGPSKRNWKIEQKITKRFQIIYTWQYFGIHSLRKESEKRT